tara:strand:- start:1826 stop:1996 length:171 start_codon:yes stop_codon:yes gene_type:complete
MTIKKNINLSQNVSCLSLNNLPLFCRIMYINSLIFIEKIGLTACEKYSTSPLKGEL